MGYFALSDCSSKDSDPPNTLFSVYNANVGPCYGYAVGSWAERNKASETDTLSCFVDIPLANANLTQRTLYICSLSDYSAHASVKISLPDAPAALTLPIQKTITLKGRAMVPLRPDGRGSRSLPRQQL